MANSNRRFLDKDGRMLIPMNVDGGVWEDNFFTTAKFITLAVLLVLDFLAVLWCSNFSNKGAKIFVYIGIALVSQYVIRIFILEEKYYYKMYQKMKSNSITTPAIFWGIANIKETEDGAVAIYSDMKIGVFVRLERDTIVGKPEQFKEQHYDAVSDFYRELNLRNYKFVQLNIMEQAGKDPRLQHLDELVSKTDNKNLAKIMEMQVGYIKNITRATLFESDYFFIYTEEMNRSDRIAPDVIDCVYTILDGGFISYRILSTKEILDLVKDIYSVKYFDYTEATLSLFKNSGVSVGKPFIIKEIEFDTGERVKIDEVGINRLNTLASYVTKNDIKYGEWTIKDALKGRIKNSISGNRSIASDLEDDNSAGYSDDGYIDLDNYAFGVDTNYEEQSKELVNKNVKPKSDKSMGNHGDKNQYNLNNKNQQNINEAYFEDDFIIEDDDTIDF